MWQWLLTKAGSAAIFTTFCWIAASRSGLQVTVPGSWADCKHGALPHLSWGIRRPLPDQTTQATCVRRIKWASAGHSMEAWAKGRCTHAACHALGRRDCPAPAAHAS